MRLMIPVLILLLGGPHTAKPRDSSSDLRATMEALSRTMTSGGGGWRDYDALLHAQFTRWD